MSTENTQVVETEDSKRAQAIEKARPITATQAKAAMAVVATDYDQLAADLNEAATTRINQVTAEIRSRYLESGRSLEEHWTRLQEEFHARVERERNALIQEASEQGVRLRPREFAYRDQPPKVIGEGAEIEAATAGIRADLATALEQVRRDRRQAERTINVATLTAVTEDVIRGIPSAQEMFANAMQIRQQREAERLRITSGGDA